MKGFFGNLFDMNHDGKLDTFEKAADFAAFASTLDSMNEKKDTATTAVSIPSDYNDMNEDKTFDQEIDGLDVDDLEFMEKKYYIACCLFSR